VAVLLGSFEVDVLVVGSTGFVGSFVVDKLNQEDIGRIGCFVRKSSRLEEIEKYDVDKRFGNLADFSSICEALKGQEAVISVASLKYGFCKNLVRACEIMNIRRVVFISTTGIFTQLESEEKRIVMEAERRISESPIEYTVIRPTMIYGDWKDENMHFLIEYLKKHSVVPIFGNGRYLQQPVYVEDVASAVVKALSTKRTIRKSYNISGRFPLSYNEVIDTICKNLGKGVLKVRIPYHLSLSLVAILQVLQKNPRFTVGQVRRLNENKVFDYSKAKEDFGYNPISFEDGIRREIQSLG
jgi:nucleoside-diphosphate-sugar epimerase